MSPETAPAPAPILFVHYGEDWIRGSERCLLDLVQYLDPTRFRPIVWCNSPTLARAVERLGAPCSVGRFTVLLDWRPPRFAFLSYASLVRQGLELVRRHKIRLIHANSGAPNQWMIPVARSARIPILAHLHAIYDLRGRCIFGLHHPTRIVGVSFETIQGLRGDGVPSRRTRVIHNGIDVARLSQGDASRLRSELGIAPAEVVIAGVGSLIPRKGFHVLLQSFRLLRAEHPHTRLLIVGDGPERERLTALAREQGIDRVTHFLGERNDVGAIFRDAADIMASASFEEAFGLAVMEAAAMGLPVVATRVAGTAEVVEEEVTGIIVSVEDAAALARGLSRLVADASLRARFGEAGRTLIESEYTIARNVASFSQVYDLLLAKPATELGWRAGFGPWKPWARFAGGVARRKLSGLFGASGPVAR